MSAWAACRMLLLPNSQSFRLHRLRGSTWELGSQTTLRTCHFQDTSISWLMASSTVGSPCRTAGLQGLAHVHQSLIRCSARIPINNARPHPHFTVENLQKPAPALTPRSPTHSSKHLHRTALKILATIQTQWRSLPQFLLQIYLSPAHSVKHDTRKLSAPRRTRRRNPASSGRQNYPRNPLPSPVVRAPSQTATLPSSRTSGSSSFRAATCRPR